MNLRKINLLIFLLSFTVGCDKVNKMQKYQIDISFDCYEIMNESLTDPKTLKQIELLSYQVFPKKQLPFYIPDKKYKLIPREQIFNLLDSASFTDCRSELDSLGDFAGIRFINPGYISYDICRIKRYTLETRLTGHHPIETHRLIYNSSDKKFKKEEFLSEDERLSYYEQIKPNWTYIVSIFD